jgi:cell division septation protein DedD
MSRSPARYILLLAAVAACNRGDKSSTGDSTGAPNAAQTKAPAPPAAGSAGAAGAAQGAKPGSTPTRPAPNRPAADPNAAANAELASAKELRTVQVGAFPSSATAEWWVGELKRQGIPAFAAKATVNGQEVSRLRIGVATTAAGARAIADKIHARYHWPVWITTVKDKSVVTGEMLAASRRYAGR